MLGQKQTTVGIDIGNSSVKAVKVSVKDGRASLLSYHISSIIKPSDPAARNNAISSAISEAARAIGVAGSKVIASIDCPQTTIRHTMVPRLGEKETRDALLLEAESFSGTATYETCHDCAVIGKESPGSGQKCDAIIASCPRKTSEGYVSLLGRSDIHPAAIIPTAYALQIYGSSFTVKDNGSICLIDIGDAFTELVLLKGGKFAFSRKLPVAGKDLRDILSAPISVDDKMISLSEEEIETVKREISLSAGPDDTMLKGKVRTIKVLGLLRPMLEHLISEISRSFEFFTDASGDSHISAIYLYGGFSSLKGLAAFLSERLGVATHSGMDIPLGNITETNPVPPQDRAILDIAIGAALSGGEINLLPRIDKASGLKEVLFNIAKAFCSFLLLAVIASAVYLNITITNNRQRIAILKSEMAAIDSQYKNAMSNITADYILSDEPRWADIFIELSNLMPEGIVFTKMEGSGSSLKMTGVISSPGGEDILSNFVLTLEKGIFDKVRLDKTRDLGKENAVEFEIQCQVDYEY